MKDENKTRQEIISELAELRKRLMELETLEADNPEHTPAASELLISDLLLDEKEICQLVFNLVNNALEAITSGGIVKVKTFWVDETVILAVQDEGHGIDPQILSELGTPFLTTKVQGTGLGLPVCYRIATRHNAKIDIKTHSTGTTVLVRFSLS